MIAKLWKRWIEYHNAQKRADDYWRYKDGEIIDTNAKHYTKEEK